MFKDQDPHRCLGKTVSKNLHGIEDCYLQQRNTDFGKTFCKK